MDVTATAWQTRHLAEVSWLETEEGEVVVEVEVKERKREREIGRCARTR